MSDISIKKYLILFLFGCLVFLAHFKFSGQAVWGDGIDYWVYLPSIYFDHDINFENEYKHIYTPENNNRNNPVLTSQIQKTARTSLGKVLNPHEVGTAIVWFPAFVAADTISTIFNLPRNGFADVYQIICGLWSVGIAVVGLLFCEQIVYRITKDQKISSLSIVLIYFATPLLYYGSYDVLNSHFASFFLSNIFWYILIFKYKNWKDAVLLGLIVGLATLVRLQDSLLILMAWLFISWKKKLIFNYNVLTMGIIFIFMIIPLIVVWKYIYGVPYSQNYAGSFEFQPDILGSLFHKTNGLFFRTPVLLISLLGIKSFYKKNSKIFLIFLVFFIMQFLVISLHGGWRAAAYGGRMYISSLPLFAILLSYLLIIIQKKWGKKILYLFVSFFVILNVASIGSFVLLEKEVNSGKKRGLEEQTQLRVEKIIQKYLRQ